MGYQNKFEDFPVKFKILKNKERNNQQETEEFLFLKPLSSYMCAIIPR